MLLVNHADIMLVQGPDVLPKHKFSIILEIVFAYICYPTAKIQHMYILGAIMEI